MAWKSLFVGTLLAAASVSPASAHCFGYGCNGGAAFAGGVIAGGILGALSAPPPQPYIVVVPSPPVYVPIPQLRPTYVEPEPAVSPTVGYVSPPEAQRHWYCRTSARWYPDTLNCAVPWSR